MSIQIDGIKIGLGYDIHRLVEGRKLMLGGIEIEHHLGLLGHSDADVVLHAIIDAILGALGLGDIGSHFPDNDMRYKDIDSKELLAHILALMKEKAYEISNLDINIIAQKPKLSGYRDSMRAKLAELLYLDSGAVNIKFKTNEGMDSMGEEQSIVSQAIVLLLKKKSKH